MSNQSTELATPETEEMLTAPVPATHNENVPTKNIVLDLGQFDRDKTKFENQWREIRLFLKSNRVVVVDNKIATVLAQLRGGMAGIYIQKKIDELEDTKDTQDWEKIYQGNQDSIQ